MTERISARTAGSHSLFIRRSVRQPVVARGAMAATAALAMLAAGSAFAAVTPYSWIRAGEANSPFLDSSGNNRFYNMAFSTGNTGTPDFALVPFPAGGPLGGPGGPVSTISTLWGPVGRAASAMWQDPWTFPATNYVMEAWVLPVGTGGSGSNVNSQLASTGDGTGIAFRGRFIPEELDPVNPEVVLNEAYIELRLVTFGPTAADNQQSAPLVLPTTRWTHLAAVNNGGTLQLYVNGVVTGDSMAFNKASSGASFVGGGSGTNNPFHGYIDELRFSTFADGQFAVSDLLLRAPGPQILKSPGATEVWEGGPAPFEVELVYDTTATYQWKLAGNPIAGATGPELILPAVGLANTGGVYSVDATTDSVTVSSANAALTVVPVKTADRDFYRTAVQAESSLLAYFPVDDDAATTLTNLKNGTGNGTLDAGVTFDGRTDRSLGKKALRFTGAGQVTLPPNAAFEFPSQSGTVEAIVSLRPGSRVGQATLFSMAENGGVYYQLRASMDGGTLFCSNDQLPQAISWSVPVTLKDRFAHVAFVFAPDTVTAYVDGESLGTKPHPNFGSAQGLTGNIGSTGRDGDGNLIAPWAGTIDELAIYSAALSPTTLAVHNSRYKFGTAVTIPAITSQPTGTTNVLAGGAPAFRVVSTGTAPLTYQWKLNGNDIAGNPTASTATLVLNQSTVAMSGQYTVTVTNPQGSDTSDPFTVNFAAPPDTYSGYVLADNPTAYWRMNDTSATLLRDYAGGLNGTYSTTATLGVAGVPDIIPVDTAVQFTASGTPLSNAVVPYSPNLNPSGAFTIECWVKPNLSGANSTAMISSQNRDTGRAGYVFYQGFDGEFWGMHMGLGDGVIRLGGGPAPVAGRWDHIAATWDGSNVCRFYVNGELVNTENQGPFRANLSQQLEFGSRFNGGIPWNGTLDEVAFYNKALTLEQLRKHWSITWKPAVITQQPEATLNATEAGTWTLTGAASGFPNTYQWLKDGNPLEATNNPDGSSHYPQGVNSASLVVSQSSLTDAGTYRLIITNPLGEQVTSESVVTIAKDVSPPVVEYVSADASMKRVRVGFDRWMDPATAMVPTNYTFTGGLKAASIALTNEPGVLDVVLAADMTPGGSYSLSMSGLKDQRSTPNTIGSNTTPFNAFSLKQGSLALDFYFGISGNFVDDLRNDPQFPQAVYHNTSVESFSTRTLATNDDLNNNPEFAALGLGNNYGTHLYGWITPAISGNYTFFLNSDDGSELNLSPDANPATADTIALVPGDKCCQGFKEPGATVPETSAPIALVAGQRYYIEAFQKEGGGGDYVQVAWRMEGDTTAAPGLPVIPGTFLSSYAELQIPGLNLPVLAGGQIILTWNGPGKLQESADLASWTDVPGNPASPYTTPVTNRRFYRLVP